MPTQLANITAAMQLSSRMMNTATFGDSTTASPTLQSAQQITNGISAAQADRFWLNEYVILSGTNQDIDLSDFNAEDLGAGVGNDHLGLPITLVSVVGVMLVVDPTSVGALLFGNEGTANEWISPFNNVAGAALGPFAAGATLVLIDSSAVGFVVGPTNKMLRLAASAGDVTVKIGILGRSA